MDALLISVISACTELVASIAGPLVTLTVSLRQFNASVLSANRQKWIETLRDLLAEVIPLIVAALVSKSRYKDQWNEGRTAFEGNPALLENSSGWCRGRHRNDHCAGASDPETRVAAREKGGT